MSVYKVSKEELDNIPIASKEFLDDCKTVGEKYKKKYKNIEDYLVVGVDFSLSDTDMLMVMRRKGKETHIINLLKDDEAREVYNKLIGK